MKKVLIIDDDAHNRFLLKLILQKENLSVVEAKTGKEGIEKVQKENPDLILLDVMMPDINGYEVYKKIKDKNIPIIFLTASENNEKDAEYILKPIDINSLITKIKEKLR